jgi:hypothetical protein
VIGPGIDANVEPIEQRTAEPATTDAARMPITASVILRRVVHDLSIRDMLTLDVSAP